MKKSKYWSFITALVPLFIWLMVLVFPFVSRMSSAPAAMRNEMFHHLLLSNLLLIIIFYIHSYLIYPVREKKNGIYIYILLLLGCLIVFIFINQYLRPEMPRFRFPGPERGLPPPRPLMEILPFTFVVVVSFCYRLYIDKISKDKRIKDLENIQLKTELEFLSSQISPHFMFNVLNTLVYMSRKKSELVESSLISLSQLMRYMLYESTEGQITLAQEIEYLKNYINLQLLRFGDTVQLNLYLSGPFEQFTIEPMLLIPFVENAFKHGIGILEHPIIDISVTVDEEERTLRMEVVNGIAVPDHSAGTLGERNSGIGLVNVQRRLELLYPERHSFSAGKKENTFVAKLQINL